MNDSLPELNKKRKSKYRKSQAEEDFLTALNKILHDWEIDSYQTLSEELPFIFVFGLPRSGTTLLTQLIAHSFDVGYINNFVARFWLAPVTGIRLSKIILQGGKRTDFRSTYAATNHLTDIHEFGYFWRHWLQKERFSDFVHAREREQQIDWNGLKKTLLNIQYTFGKALVFKNIFGAYHVERFLSLLDKALFVYIERDPLDNAVSILEARSKFYADLNLWWSTCPVEYEQLKDLPYMEQIAGQVYYLRRFYERQIRAVTGQRIVQVHYRALCQNPLEILRKIQRSCRRDCDFNLPIKAEPPSRLEYRHYADRAKLRHRFQALLEQFDTLD